MPMTVNNCRQTEKIEPKFFRILRLARLLIGRGALLSIVTHTHSCGPNGFPQKVSQDEIIKLAAVHSLKLGEVGDRRVHMNIVVQKTRQPNIVRGFDRFQKRQLTLTSPGHGQLSTVNALKYKCARHAKPQFEPSREKLGPAQDLNWP